MLFFNQYKWASLWSGLTVFLSALIIFNTLVYFQSAANPTFLIEKGSLVEQPLWRAAFYFHIVSACVCLVAGAFLMFPQLLRFRRLHFFLGYIYLNSVLWVAAPTGLILAPNAKGGAAAGIGFVITGAFWWASTWIGYRKIRQHDVESHIRWMLRSYALTLSAPVFRVIQLLLAFTPIDYELNYILSVWISLFVSITLSEVCIHQNFKSNKQFRFQFLRFLKGNSYEPLPGNPVIN